ncbi:MAG: 4-hydroxythreonine-4-phosphate dehydrogenase PdxA [Candidatus Omnitrophica bacterium]|nr:4-hydroxythreonine-4-phosphate dehydrogenase PdxA [Candidatus Omnitrophota bacterium]MCM8826830.1 4-hydroxythreonine-4-phosphate dehydrogenase PdxA [Candidatus Omnitrophota bacterium]
MIRKIVITIGDPSGCGAFITVKAIEALRGKKTLFFIVGDKLILERIRGFKKLCGKIELIDLSTPQIDKIKPGFISYLNGQASLNYLNEALKIIEREKINALVTAPVSKEAIQLVEPSFQGHTEYLAKHFGVNNFAMMMVSPLLKVVLLTRHILLREVSNKLNYDDIKDNLELIYDFLQKKFKIKNPKVVFASFNPHAGIDTFLEREEKIIKQAIEGFGKPVYGPYPADTMFLRNKLKKFDCVIALYHDQAMIPFKLLSFDKGVNLTIGLPIIRTSPAHGVAFDLMRKKIAPSHLSMLEAIKLSSVLSL